MSIDRSFRDSGDLQGLQGDAIIELMTLDLIALDSSISPADRYIRFVNWTVADGQSVQYGGLTYSPVPYKAEGFVLQTEGVPPNPLLTVSNIGLEFTALVNTWDDLVGAKLTRRRVLARHLDSGGNPDSNAHWPDELWTIQQKESENKLSVSFRLSTAFDLDGITIPRRRALRYTCVWEYRKEGCDYAGPPVADASDNLLSSSTDPLIQAVVAGRTALATTKATLDSTATAYTAASSTFNTAQNNLTTIQNTAAQGPQWVFAEERYDMADATNYGVIVGDSAWWGGNLISLNNEYRIGSYVEYRFQEGTSIRYNYHRIQRFTLDYSSVNAANGALSAAQAVYNSAQAAFTTAQNNYNNAQAAYSAAIAQYTSAVNAWTASPTRPTTGDVCGKRLASCRLRFYDPITNAHDSLPFGAFPGLTT